MDAIAVWVVVVEYIVWGNSSLLVLDQKGEARGEDEHSDSLWLV